jgi:hypothetical protein
MREIYIVGTEKERESNVNKVISSEPSNVSRKSKHTNNHNSTYVFHSVPPSNHRFTNLTASWAPVNTFAFVPVHVYNVCAFCGSV